MNASLTIQPARRISTRQALRAAPPGRFIRPRIAPAAKERPGSGTG